MFLIKFFLNQPILVRILVLVAISAGVFSVGKIPRESYPSVSFGMIPITTAYPGAPPAEIEKLITKKIEDAVWDQSDIDHLESNSFEGRSQVRVVLKEELTDNQIKDAYDEIVTRIAQVSDLPDDSQQPVSFNADLSKFIPIIDIALSGPYSDLRIQEIAEKMRDKLQSTPGVSQVNIASSFTRLSAAGEQRQAWVELNPALLEQYGVTQNDVVNAIKLRNYNLPSGNIYSGQQEYVIRVMGEFESPEQINDVIVKSSPASLIKIKDIARTTFRLEKKNILTRESMNPALLLRIFKQSDSNIIDVVNNVRKDAKEFENTYPDTRITFRNDMGHEVNKVIGILVNNMYLGMLLVAVALFLLLGWKNASLTTFAIPFSFLVTFIFMYLTDYTFSSFSLFALLLASGMLVDNSIVIIDNINRYIKKGLPAREAAIEGAQEVIWPVFSSTLTTIFAFSPILMMSGRMGKMMAVFPMVVNMALLSSMGQALLFLPNLVALFMHEHETKKTPKPWGRKMWLAFFALLPITGTIWLIKRILKILKFLLDELEMIVTRRAEKGFELLVVYYQKALLWVIGKRYLLIITVVVFSSAVAMSMRFLDIRLYTEIERDYLVLQFDMPIGTKLEYTDSVTRIIEHELSKYPETEIMNLTTFVGYKEGGMGASTGYQNAQINIDLPEKEKRTLNNEQLMTKIRKFMNTLSMIKRYEFYQRLDGPPAGRPVEIRVLGDDLEKLNEYAERIKSDLEKMEGIADLSSTYEEGKMELRIIPYHERLRQYGLNYTEIATSIRQAVEGVIPGSFFTRNNEEVEILVKYDEKFVRDAEEIKSLKIPTKTGEYVMVADLADIKTIRGPTRIEHYNKTRMIRVLANVEGKLTSDKANRYIMEKYKDFEKENPGYRLRYGGRAEEQAKSFSSLGQAFIIAILLIFGILATQFRNAYQPLIVMITVPFAFVGVTLGLHISQLPISLNALISIIALAGVVVNNSIILVDFINQARLKGINRWESIIQAGALRLRPILLTSITTLSGLVPMALNLGGTNETFRPMAICFSWGLSFSTLLTLFMIPALVATFDDLTSKRGHLPENLDTPFEETKNKSKDINYFTKG
ncbi:MAG: efflux RND transporter permease subunit [Candidatus Coatesbacteria bacterium]|nr:efflux RND transporter permease subunit [Candidatus Coatesbacteria bacterium]